MARLRRSVRRGTKRQSYELVEAFLPQSPSAWAHQRHRRNIWLLQRVVCGNKSFQLMHQDDRNHQRVESIVINTSLAYGQLLQAWERRRTLYDERFQRVYRPCTSNFKLRD